MLISNVARLARLNILIAAALVISNFEVGAADSVSALITKVELRATVQKYEEKSKLLERLQDDDEVGSKKKAILEGLVSAEDDLLTNMKGDVLGNDRKLV